MSVRIAELDMEKISIVARRYVSGYGQAGTLEQVDGSRHAARGSSTRTASNKSQTSQAHNVHGPHDPTFYKFLIVLEEEWDALKLSGYGRWIPLGRETRGSGSFS
jgi:hypothetical protein